MRSTLTMIALLLTSSAIIAQLGETPMSGVVRDERGKALAGVDLYLHVMSDERVPHIRTAKADENGRFEIKFPPVMTYCPLWGAGPIQAELFAFRRGFAITCVPGMPASRRFDLVLTKAKPSPTLICDGRDIPLAGVHVTPTTIRTAWGEISLPEPISERMARTSNKEGCAFFCPVKNGSIVEVRCVGPSGLTCGPLEWAEVVRCPSSTGRLKVTSSGIDPEDLAGSEIIAFDLERTWSKVIGFTPEGVAESELPPGNLLFCIHLTSRARRLPFLERRAALTVREGKTTELDLPFRKARQVPGIVSHPDDPKSPKTVRWVGTLFGDGPFFVQTRSTIETDGKFLITVSAKEPSPAVYLGSEHRCSSFGKWMTEWGRGHHMQATGQFMVDGNPRLEEEKPKRPVTISGRIIGKNGKPAPYALIAVEPRVYKLGTDLKRVFYTDKNGEFACSLVGIGTLRVEHAGESRSKFFWREKKRIGLVIRFDSLLSRLRRFLLRR